LLTQTAPALWFQAQVSCWDDAEDNCRLFSWLPKEVKSRFELLAVLKWPSLVARCRASGEEEASIRGFQEQDKITVSVPDFDREIALHRCLLRPENLRKLL
jgi:hypothetical protein